MSRSAATRAALLDAALQEFSAFGFGRSSMESVSRGAGVSRATLYLHWRTKNDLFRSLVETLHADQLAAMQEALAAPGGFEERLLAVLEARFVRFVELTSVSPHAAELYDQHSRLCGDLARSSQERSEKLLSRMLRDAQREGAIDLSGCGLSAPRAASVLFDCAHGAKGEDPSRSTPMEYRDRLRQVVRVLVVGLSSSPATSTPRRTRER